MVNKINNTNIHYYTEHMKNSQYNIYNFKNNKLNNRKKNDSNNYFLNNKCKDPESIPDLETYHGFVQQYNAASFIVY